MIFSRLRMILLCAASLFPLSLYAAEDVRILNAGFGVFKTDADGEVVFEPARIIPKRVGLRYGWAIEVRTKKRSLSVREEVIQAVPEPARENGTDSDKGVVRLPKRSQISQRQLVPMDGWIYGEWAIAADEVAGPRRFHVLVESLPPVEFEFEVSVSPP